MEEPLLKLLFNNSDLLTSLFKSGTTGIQAGLITFGSLAVATTVVTFFVLHPIKRQVQREKNRSLKMLLMIPIDVIESVAAIKDFFSSQNSSEKEKWKLALQESVARNKGVLDNSVDAIVYATTSGKVDYVNSALLSLLGYSQSELIGQSINMLLPEEIAKHHDS